MGRNHSWLGTGRDADLLLSWLYDAGGTSLDRGRPSYADLEPGSRLILHFAAFGPIVFLPEDLNEFPLPAVGDNSLDAKLMILARGSRQANPGRPVIDVEKSPIAFVTLPRFRDERFWVGGELSFPTSRLEKVFPKLHRLNQRLERFLGKHPTVFDNRKGADSAGFSDRFCGPSVLCRVVALPDAFAQLIAGARMIDVWASDVQFHDFCRRQERRARHADGKRESENRSLR